jgi:hypothetical protein
MEKCGAGAEMDHLEDMDIDGAIILSLKLKEYCCRL